MWLRMVQLEQGFWTSEMGFNGAIAGQQFQTPNVSYGSFATKLAEPPCPLISALLRKRPKADSSHFEA